MVRLATDADFNRRILTGLLRKLPNLDIVRVQDVGLRTATDPEILEWAATKNRVVLSHDRETMIAFAYERVRRGQPMPGVFLVLKQQTDIGRTIDSLVLIDACSETADWANQVVFLPW